MAIRFKKGNIFDQLVEAIVNPVNCVGVMGKGLALQFKIRYPDNYKAYKEYCNHYLLVPGHLLTIKNNKSTKYIINFPTKDHWKNKSKLSFIEAGLNTLINEIEKYNIQSIAIPPLGCGNGGLNWKEVKLLIEDKLSDLNKVDIIIIEPY